MSFLRRWFGGKRDDEPPADAAPKSKREAQRRAREEARDEEEEEEERKPRRRVTKVRRPVVELICEAAKASHPNEFGGTLRAEGDTVTELILVPATIGGEAHAILPLYNLPVDLSIVGTVHSHPSPWAIPSDADLQLFRHFGHTHIICAHPYTPRTWIAYDHNGERVELEMVP